MTGAGPTAGGKAVAAPGPAEGSGGGSARRVAEVPVAVPGRRADYRVLVGEGALDSLPRLLAERFPGRAVAAVADAEAERLHGRTLAGALPAGAPVLRLAPGEENKTRAEKERIEDALLARRFGRDTVIVAFGGGVTTDLAGFAAATYLRGVPFVAVPTTLLAAVDASVGGKTGLNTARGKNLVGAIHPPAAVLADTRFLATLPAAEFRNGLAEAVKMAATLDASAFSFLEGSREAVAARDPEAVARTIALSVRLKASVVARDEREAGLRQVLNFGHTVGHGLEGASGYRLAHGAAVAIGMVAESRMARAAGRLGEDAESRLTALLGAFGLPRRAPSDLARKAVLRAMGSDKKTVGGEARFVTLEDIGRVRRRGESGETRYSHPMPESAASAGLEEIGL